MVIEEIEANMIEDNITIHDQFQFEIKWAYKFLKNKKSTTYNIESYFFIPQSLGINRVSYTRSDFYNDLLTYIRLKTPTILLQNIANGSNSLIDDLRALFTKTVDHPDTFKLTEYENNIKLLCCKFKSSLREHVAFIQKKLRTEDLYYLIDQYIESTEKISGSYRELRKILNVPSIDRRQFSKYLFGDEYISLTIEDYTYNLLNLLEEKKDPTIKHDYYERLLNVIKKEIEYRRNNNYPSIAQIDSDNEILMFRKSILKKYMGSILFLDVRTENNSTLAEQVIFGVAAGLSMIFATAVAFFTQKSYGNLSFPLFVALVISYMFKDRIKDILRIYLSGRLGRILYNYKTYLKTKSHEKLGWCKEHFSFINESVVPGEILRLRNKDHITEIENGWMGEQVLLYKKVIRLYTSEFKNISSIGSVDGVNDITRFNVKNFLAKMDNPSKPIYAVNGNEYKNISGKRVYHLNLIIKYSIDDKAFYKRFRIILNREGIKSIEFVDCY